MDLSRRRNSRIILSLILLLNIFIYLPSLKHLPRDDQVSFFLETACKDDFPALIRDTYSYNRVRYNRGDTLLFRPLFFVLLSAQKSFFGTEYSYYQLTGILFHLIFLLVLYNFFRALSPVGFIPYLFVLFFSVLHAIQEMVIWQHITGYIIFMLLVAAALKQVFIISQKPPQNTPRNTPDGPINWATTFKDGPINWATTFKGELKHVALLSLFLGLSCFIYDTGLIFSLLIACYILFVKKEFRQRKGVWLLLLMPAVLYLVFNITDYFFWHPFSVASPEISIAILPRIVWNFPLYIKNSLLITLSWFGSGLLPEVFTLKAAPGGRFIMETVPKINMPLVLNVLSLFVLLFYLGKAVSREKFVRYRYFLGLVAAMYISFLGVIVAGRTITRGTGHILRISSYYNYIAWVFFLVFLYLVMDHEKLAGFLKKSSFYPLAAALTALLYLNAAKVHGLNRDYNEIIREHREFVSDVNKLIRQHRKEPDFSFSYSAYPENDTFTTATDTHFVRFHLMDVLFARYINKTNPKYIISYNPAGVTGKTHPLNTPSR